MKKSISILTLAFALILALPAQAQRTPGMVGIGGQFGEPSGLSLKIYNPNRASGDFLAAWDFNEYVFMNGHATFERHLNNRGTAHFYFGPGAFIEFRDRAGDQEDDVEGGLSAKFGLGFLFNQIEIFGNITPRLQVTPSTQGELGGGVGLRVYF